jgi:hypothetical protein
MSVTAVEHVRADVIDHRPQADDHFRTRTNHAHIGLSDTTTTTTTAAGRAPGRQLIRFHCPCFPSMQTTMRPVARFIPSA